ncbi:PAS domain S-box [Halovivax ruber XH-70]|uniref:histidine kinase n=1 Tax=Halovivax ruber (strain DSM 18193 / JCM 13892 / XH-70) TaxID=797302 RepID=L0I9Q9_HALRX|nr:GAF domain-containing sensor histidine kinase [Halovivax ruber]AGB14697.1 PAS domain S-box [Halovivax ruber XH-70]
MTGNIGPGDDITRPEPDEGTDGATTDGGEPVTPPEHEATDGSPSDTDAEATADESEGSTALPTEDDRSKIARLHEMATEIVACREEAELFDLAVDTAKGVLDFDTTAFLIHEEREDGEWLVHRAGTSTFPLDYETEFRPTGLAGETFRTGETFHVDDAESHPVAQPASERFKSAISVPIGGSYGVFQAISTEYAGFDDRDVELAEILASHVAETLRRIRVEERLRERRELVTRLHEGTLGIAAADSEAELFEHAVDTAERILDIDVCYLGIVEDGEFVPKGRPSWPIREEIGALPLEYGLMGETYRTGESYRIGDAATDDRTHDEVGDFRACISVPIDEFGVLQAVSTTPDTYDESDLELVELLAAHVAESLARLRAEQDVVEEHDRLSALFANVPDPAIRFEFVDDEPVVRDVNDAFEGVFGYDRATVMGESVDDYIVPPGFEDEGNALNEALLAGETVQHVTKRETAEGLRDVRIDVVPLQLGEHSPEGFAIYTDITVQKRRERELREQNERLDRFASVLSHDLRNPLSVAAGYIEQARETDDLSLLEEAERGIDRSFDIVEDVLTLAREGGEVTETAPVDLPAVASDAWANVDTGAATLDLSTTATVEADRSRLRQLLENLVRNCVEHGTPDGDGQDLTITVADTPDGFAVVDDGCGFGDEVDLDRLFDSGYTTSHDGTGLGLSIVSEIAAGHGWSVSAEESEAGGARFDFQLGA